MATVHAQRSQLGTCVQKALGAAHATTNQAADPGTQHMPMRSPYALLTPGVPIDAFVLADGHCVDKGDHANTCTQLDGDC